ncbi:hypothetical protein [Enhygromyxa salina]|uniref:hypothetical protein n=1 Tax=Enhygromyxa salina TaxID=215803 RepID=UPI000D09305F|nr:hypothetical protein [Enhygromyxa salina]
MVSGPTRAPPLADVEALRRLLKGEGPARRRALCATEVGGAHPRAIASTLTPVAGGGWHLLRLGPDLDANIVGLGYDTRS